MHGVHGRLGPGVGEAPQRQAEATASSSATPIASSVGWAKWVPRADAGGDRLDEGGVAVTGDGGAVPAVHVDVLVAVDVPDVRALAVAHPHRLRLGDLPVRGRPAGERAARLDDQCGAARLAPDERLGLGLDQGVDAVGGPVDGHGGGHGDAFRFEAELSSEHD